MSKGLFFTGDVLKNTRNLQEEEASRQQLYIQQEQLNIQKEELALKRKDARKKNNQLSYEELSTQGAERYSNYFSQRQSDIDAFTTENSDAIQDNPNGPEAVQLRQLKRDFRNNVNQAVNRANLLNTYNEQKLQNKTKAYKTTDDGSLYYEFEEQKFLDDLSGGMSFEEAISLHNVDIDNIINKTDPNTMGLVVESLLERESSFYDGDVNKVKLTQEQINKQVSITSKKMRVDSNSTWKDNAFKMLYMNSDLTVVNSDGEETTSNAMDVFFAQEEDIDMVSDEEKSKLLPKLDLDGDGVAETVNENFDKEMSDRYANWLTNALMEENIPAEKRSESKPKEERGQEYFEMTPEYQKILDDNDPAGFTDTSIVNGIAWNTKIQDAGGGDKIELSLGTIDNSGTNYLALEEYLANKFYPATSSKSGPEQYKIDKAAGDQDKINKTIGQLTAEATVATLTLNKEGKSIAIVTVEGGKQFVVPLENITSQIKSVYTGTKGKKPSKGYYIFLNAGGGASAVPTSGGAPGDNLFD